MVLHGGEASRRGQAIDAGRALRSRTPSWRGGASRTSWRSSIGVAAGGPRASAPEAPVTRRTPSSVPETDHGARTPHPRTGHGQRHINPWRSTTTIPRPIITGRPMQPPIAMLRAIGYATPPCGHSSGTENTTYCCIRQDAISDASADPLAPATSRHPGRVVAVDWAVAAGDFLDRALASHPSRRGPRTAPPLHQLAHGCPGPTQTILGGQPAVLAADTLAGTPRDRRTLDAPASPTRAAIGVRAGTPTGYQPCPFTSAHLPSGTGPDDPSAPGDKPGRYAGGEPMGTLGVRWRFQRGYPPNVCAPACSASCECLMIRGRTHCERHRRRDSDPSSDQGCRAWTRHRVRTTRRRCRNHARPRRLLASQAIAKPSPEISVMGGHLTSIGRRIYQRRTIIARWIPAYKPSRGASCVIGNEGCYERALPWLASSKHPPRTTRVRGRWGCD
jgi:hypothetical protein